MSPAVNQVVQSLLDRLLRISSPICFYPLQMITLPQLRVHQPQSGSYSCEQPRPVPLPAQPPVAARSTHLATPRAISTPIRCRQCPPQVIEDQWAKSPTPWFFHSATAVHSRRNSSASRPSAPPTSRVVSLSGRLWRKSPDSTSRIQKLKLGTGMGKLWDHLRRLSKPFLPETQWFSSYSRAYTVTLADL